MNTASVADVVTTMLHAVDDLDWSVVRSSFTTQVMLAPGYDATQHLIGPVVVTRAYEQTATCTTNVRAYHHVVDDGGAATWMAVRFVIDLDRGPDGWRISGIMLRLAYENGDRRLVDIARGRTAAGTGGRAGR